MNMPYQAESSKVTTARPITTDPQALHAHFLAILPRIEAHARVRFRHLRCPGRRDDSVAEVVAVSWKWFLRLYERGKDVNEFVSTLADYAVRHVRSGRRLCGQLKSRDVLSPLAQQRHGFRVERLPHSTFCGREGLYAAPHGQAHQDAMEERLKDNSTTPPADQAAFRIDYSAWLSRLGPRNREIAQDMTLDLGTRELADRHQVSPGRISQLRREFHADYREFHGEPADA